VSDPDIRFHQEWLGLIQPSEGLVVSIPVLVDAQCMARQSPAVQQTLLDLCPVADSETEQRAIRDLPVFLAEMLGLTPDLFDSGEALPPDLSLYVPEGHQTLRPTMALRKRDEPQPEEKSGIVDAETPASRAGAGYVMLVLDLPEGLPLDKPETVTGPWEYPPAAKFDRLLRHVRVPIGLLTNHREVRLIYALHGEATLMGGATFRCRRTSLRPRRPSAALSKPSRMRLSTGSLSSTPREPRRRSGRPRSSLPSRARERGVDGNRRTTGRIRFWTEVSGANGPSELLESTSLEEER
jgi:hypothetical protein